MSCQLPVEVVQSITSAFRDITDTTEFIALALVSSTFRISVQRLLLTSLDLRSTTSVRLLLSRIERDTSIGRQARCLVIGRGARKRLQPAGRGKKKHEEWVEDAVTEEDLVKLCGKLPNLEAVHLREPFFVSLRRRQLGCLSSLSRLSTLSVSGRPSHPFSLHTVGQLLLTLPQLKHLALRNLSCPTSSFANLPQPSCHLVSFALFDSPAISGQQLSWLLHSSTNAESIRSLAFDIAPTVLPSTLHTVLWAPVRAFEISCTSEQAGSIEHLPRHCPSVRKYTFRSSRRIDPVLLLKSCGVFGTVEQLVDASGVGAGLHPIYLAAALLEDRKGGVATIRSLCFSRQKRGEEGMRILRVVCRIKGISLSFFDAGVEKGEPDIPEQLASLRRSKV
ncbi:hypothetical protein JCM11251_006575 [Rhodosporidiobolus azoricus]